jgi:hypothetical protein
MKYKNKINKLKKEGKVFDEYRALNLIEEKDKKIKQLENEIKYWKKRDDNSQVREIKYWKKIKELKDKLEIINSQEKRIIKLERVVEVEK